VGRGDWHGLLRLRVQVGGAVNVFSAVCIEVGHTTRAVLDAVCMVSGHSMHRFHVPVVWIEVKGSQNPLYA
jgi:hypothetical protein